MENNQAKLGCSTSVNKPKEINNSDIISLHSADINCIDKIMDLSKNERKMLQSIKELEYRQKAYTKTIKTIQKEDVIAIKNKESQLRKDILSLTNDLTEAQLELETVKEKLEVPLLNQIDREKMACQALEKKIAELKKAMEVKDLANLNEIKKLKFEIDVAYDESCMEKEQKKRLRQEMCAINCKYRELQNDMITFQKIKKIK